MEQLWKKVDAFAQSGNIEGKVMIIIKKKYREAFDELANKRMWITIPYWETYCEHQRHQGFIGKDHYHIAMDVGKIKKATLTKAIQRGLPKDKKGKNRFRCMWPKSKNHWINALLYNKTNKHGHSDWLIEVDENIGIRRKLRNKYAEIKKSHEDEVKQFEEAKRKWRLKRYGLRNMTFTRTDGELTNTDVEETSTEEEFHMSEGEAQAHEIINAAENAGVSVLQYMEENNL